MAELGGARDGWGSAAHAWWVRGAHWLITIGFFVSLFTGLLILLVHPRLYWGEVGNDLTPALLELPIGPNHQHGGWDASAPFGPGPEAPFSARRTVALFNANAWARSLHFIAGWCAFLVGALYIPLGLRGHFREHIWPSRSDLTSSSLRNSFFDHVMLRLRPPTGGPNYGSFQKCSYTLVIFVAAPLLLLTGLAMSPAITAAFPLLSDLFGGFQSARTVHFFCAAFVTLFLVVHVLLVVRSGFWLQVRAMFWKA